MNQPTPADIRAQVNESETEICPKCHGMSAGKGTSCSKCRGIGEIPVVPEAIAEIARLTRALRQAQDDLRKMCKQRNAWSDTAQTMQAERNAAIQNKDDWAELTRKAVFTIDDLTHERDAANKLLDEVNRRLAALEPKLSRIESQSQELITQRDAARAQAVTK